MKFLCSTSIVLFLTIFVITTTGLCSQTSEQRICIADINLIFQQSEAEKDAKIKLELKQQEMSKTLNKIGKEIDELNSIMQRESMVLNKKGLAEKERNLRIKVNDLKSLKLKFQEELDTLQEELVSTIEQEIIKIISEVGKSEGFSLAINKSAVLYSHKAVDITQKVLKKYNAEYAKSR